MEEKESYLAKELDFKQKFEELQKNNIELKASTKKLEQSFRDEVKKNELEKNKQQKLIFEQKTLILKLENLKILAYEKIELQNISHAKETENMAQSFHDELKNANDRSKTKIDEKELEIEEQRKLNIELKTSILKLENFKLLANQESELQKVNHNEETEKLQQYFNNELKNANEKSQIEIESYKKNSVNHSRELENLERHFHDELKKSKVRSEKQMDEVVLKLQAKHEEKINKLQEVFEIERKNDAKEFENMREKAEEEFDLMNIRVQEKDLVIENLIEREKELDATIAEKDVKLRLLSHDIGKHMADSFKNEYDTCLPSTKKRKLQKSFSDEK